MGGRAGYKGWVMAERRPLIRPAGTSRGLDASSGRRAGERGKALVIFQVVRQAGGGVGGGRR